MLSLAAMEDTVFDDVMATLDEIAGTFVGAETLQERRLAAEDLFEDDSETSKQTYFISRAITKRVYQCE